MGIMLMSLLNAVAAALGFRRVMGTTERDFLAEFHVRLRGLGMGASYLAY